FHSAPSRRLGSRERANRGGGAPFVKAAPASADARGGLHDAIAQMGSGTLGQSAAPDPRGGAALAPLARSRKRLRRAPGALAHHEGLTAARGVVSMSRRTRLGT